MSNHVDLTVLGTLRDVMEGEYPALLHIFIKDSEQRVRDLNRLMQSPGFSSAGDSRLHQLGLMAHSFKGSSGNMGAAHLAGLCRDLEDLARTQAAASDSQISLLVQAIEDEFRVVRDVFDVELSVTLLEP